MGGVDGTGLGFFGLGFVRFGFDSVAESDFCFSDGDGFFDDGARLDVRVGELSDCALEGVR